MNSILTMEERVSKAECQNRKISLQGQGTTNTPSVLESMGFVLCDEQKCMRQFSPLEV